MTVRVTHLNGASAVSLSMPGNLRQSDWIHPILDSAYLSEPVHPAPLCLIVVIPLIVSVGAFEYFLNFVAILLSIFLEDQLYLALASLFD